MKSKTLEVMGILTIAVFVLLLGGKFLNWIFSLIFDCQFNQVQTAMLWGLHIIVIFIATIMFLIEKDYLDK